MHILSYEEIERRITALLQVAPMLQKDIVDALPMELYIDVGRVIRDMDARGLVQREKSGNSKMVTLTDAAPKS